MLGQDWPLTVLAPGLGPVSSPWTSGSPASGATSRPFFSILATLGCSSQAHSLGDPSVHWNVAPGLLHPQDSSLPHTSSSTEAKAQGSLSACRCLMKMELQGGWGAGWVVSKRVPVWFPDLAVPATRLETLLLHTTDHCSAPLIPAGVPGCAHPRSHLLTPSRCLPVCHSPPRALTLRLPLHRTRKVRVRYTWEGDAQPCSLILLPSGPRGMLGLLSISAGTWPSQLTHCPGK